MPTNSRTASGKSMAWAAVSALKKCRHIDGWCQWVHADRRQRPLIPFLDHVHTGSPSPTNSWAVDRCGSTAPGTSQKTPLLSACCAAADRPASLHLHDVPCGLSSRAHITNQSTPTPQQRLPVHSLAHAQSYADNDSSTAHAITRDAWHKLHKRHIHHSAGCP